jgi:hypothetical protein
MSFNCNGKIGGVADEAIGPHSRSDLERPAGAEFKASNLISVNDCVGISASLILASSAHTGGTFEISERSQN